MLPKKILSELQGKYRPKTLTTVLYNALTPVHEDDADSENILNPVFLTGENADTLVFPPSTDRKEMNTISSIVTLIKRAKAYCDNNQIELNSKKLVFPITEEQAALTWMGPPREHWVTLHYDPASQDAFVIDSRPYINNCLYSFSYLQQELQTGLEHIGLSANPIELKSQGIQPDNIHCGAWTVANILALANEKVSAHVTHFSADKLESVVQTNIAYAEKGTYQARDQEINTREESRAQKLYEKLAPIDSGDEEEYDLAILEPIKTDSPTLSDAATLSLTPSGSDSSLDSDEYKDCLTPLEITFSDANKERWLGIAKELFWNYIESPQKQLIAIVAREGIKHDNIKLSIDNHSHIDINQMLSELEDKYADEISPILADNSGYTFCGSGHPHHKFDAIGLDETFIQSISLADAIIYEAAMSTAESSAGHIEAFTALLQNNEDTVDVEQALAMQRAFTQTLGAHLKAQLLEAIKLKSANNVMQNKPALLESATPEAMPKEENTQRYTEDAIFVAEETLQIVDAQVAMPKEGPTQRPTNAALLALAKEKRQESAAQVAMEKEESSQRNTEAALLAQAEEQQKESDARDDMSAQEKTQRQTEKDISALKIERQQESDARDDMSAHDIKEQTPLFLEGISFDILSAAMSVIGIAAVAIGLTALCIGSLGIIPAATITAAGGLMAAAGFFSMHEEATDNAYNTTEARRPSIN